MVGSLIPLIRVRKRMRRGDKSCQPLGPGGGVYLGCRNIGMTKQCLQATKIGAAVQHMGREAMPDYMRADTAWIEPRPAGKGLQRLREPLAGHVAIPLREEEW